MPAREVEREVVGAHAEAVARHIGPPRIFGGPALVNPLLNRVNSLLVPSLVARKLIPVQPMPPGVPYIFDSDLPKDATDADA